MLLTNLIRVDHPITDADPTDIDIFSSALGTLFPDDTRNQHGDPGATVIYTPSSPRKVGGIEQIKLSVPDPAKDEERKLFAHYLWNAGVWLAEQVAADGIGTDEHVNAGYGSKNGGAVDESSEALADWSVKGETVLELGAGAHRLPLIAYPRHNETDTSQGLGLTGIVSCLAGADEVCSYRRTHVAFPNTA